MPRSSMASYHLNKVDQGGRLNTELSMINNMMNLKETNRYTSLKAVTAFEIISLKIMNYLQYVYKYYTYLASYLRLELLYKMLNCYV
jgi:hypothetical protein